ncbi:MAG TPA: glycosyltransferase family 9 protein [Planctomycetota bacterium]
MSPKRILCIRLSAVGDVINTLPALEALRRGRPDAFIGFVVEDRAHDLITNHPCVDRVHLYRRKRWSRWLRQPIHWPKLYEEFSAFLWEIRREKYEVALNFQSNLKGALHALLSGAPTRVGFSKDHCKENSHLFANRLVTPSDDPINRVEKFLSMASAAGAAPNGAAYKLPSTRDAGSRVDAWLAAENLVDYVAIHPGTSDFGALKRWPPERFGAVAAGLGLPCVITWGPGEKPIAEAVAAASGGHARVAMETRSILELAELIRRARLYVGCDSGPLHLSSAVGTPSVALFGPKDPRTYGPYNPRHRVVMKGELGRGSMEAITVEDVLAAVSDLRREISA